MWIEARLRRSALMIGAFAPVLILNGQPASAAADRIPVRPIASTPSASAPSVGGWIFFPTGQHPADARVLTVAGTRNAAGGCDVRRAGKSSASASAYQETEIAFNPTTCEVRYEVGDLVPGSAQPTENYASLSEQAAGSLGRKPASGAVALAAPGFSNSAYQDNQWLDPFGIQTTAQEQWVNWNLGGGCVTSWSWNVKWSWFQDGWNLDQHAAKTDWSSCTGIYTSAYSQMHNSIFCNFIQTDYNRFGIQNGSIIADYLDGHNDGGYAWGYNDSKDGPCAGLLHHGHIDHF